MDKKVPHAFSKANTCNQVYLALEDMDEENLKCDPWDKHPKAIRLIEKRLKKQKGS